VTMEIIERGPRGVLLELPMTTGQFVAFSGLDRDGRRYGSLSYVYDGKNIFLEPEQNEGVRANICLRGGITNKGRPIPHTGRYNFNGRMRYRKGSSNVHISKLEVGREAGLYFDPRCRDSDITNASPAGPTLFQGEYSIDQILPYYELAIPYPLIRQLTKANGAIFIAFRGSNFSIYRRNFVDRRPSGFEELDIPKKYKRLIAFYNRSDEPALIKVTTNDILWFCSRAFSSGKENILLGCTQKERYIGFTNLKGWGRATCGRINKDTHYLSPDLFETTKSAPLWNPPRFTIEDVIMGDDEMTEDEKTLMRAWWHAYVTQMARLGEGIPPEHTEAAEKFLA